MKKIFLFAMMAVLAVGTLSSCSDDYADASSPHVYSDSENVPLKGSDENMATVSVKMAQAEAGTQVVTVDLTDYADNIQKQLGMSLDEAISGLSNGSVRFYPINPNRRVWDKTPANGGDNTWLLSANGIVTTDSLAAIKVQFVPEAKQLKLTLTNKAATGIIPVTCGFVKTDESSFPINFRCQTLVNVTDASVVDVPITVPKGDYAVAPFNFSSIAKNIEFAFGETNLYNIAKGLDTENAVYDVYIMSSTGALLGGPGKYTANGAGYWLNQKIQIVNWGKDDFALFIEPFIYDDEKKDYYENGGGFNIGRLSNSAPASGTVLPLSVVLKQSKGDKMLTINFTITFE